MGKAKGQNAKVVAGNEKKAVNQRKKDVEVAKQTEVEDAKEWAKGSNARGANRKEAADGKADEVARKRREKEELLAAEEESLSKTPQPKLPTTKTKSKKKKNQSSFALLEESLVNDADKKLKSDKKAARLKKEQEERALRERQRKEQENGVDSDTMDPLMRNTLDMIGGDEENFRGRKANVSSLEENGGTGIDSALSALSISKGADQHPEKRAKAMHKAFEERMLPEMKEQYKGLKLSQYKEKIFQLWRKSPENPLNQQL